MHDPPTVGKVRFPTTTPFYLENDLDSGLWNVGKKECTCLQMWFLHPQNSQPSILSFIKEECLATESALFQQLAFITLADAKVDPFYREKAEAQL